MAPVVSYLSALVCLAAFDAVWLTTTGDWLYKKQLGDILLQTVRVGPAIAFYLMYPIGLVIFAIIPALKAGSVTTAIINAAAFGAIAYATYDLTNFATMRNWTMQITVLDICWGTVLSAVASAVGFYVTTLAGGWLGYATR